MIFLSFGMLRLNIWLCACFAFTFHFIPFCFGFSFLKFSIFSFGLIFKVFFNDFFGKCGVFSFYSKRFGLSLFLLDLQTCLSDVLLFFILYFLNLNYKYHWSYIFPRCTLYNHSFIISFSNLFNNYFFFYKLQNLKFLIYIVFLLPAFIIYDVLHSFFPSFFHFDVLISGAIFPIFISRPRLSNSPFFFSSNDELFVSYVCDIFLCFFMCTNYFI